MARKNVHVVPAGNGWAVKQEGRPTPISNHRTQAAAADAARPVARRNASEVVIHRPDGTIRNSNSHGNDPHPPRDRKH